MMRTSAVALAALLCGPAICVYAQSAGRSKPRPVGSVYTSLVPPACKTVQVQREEENSTQRCPGVGGYELLVLDSDARMSISLVTPSGQKHPLDFWDVITPHFSTLGKRAEWRVIRQKRKVVPIALIVRVNASEDPETSKVTSYLAIAKISEEQICVTNKITQSPRANAEARVAADSSPTRPCLKP